jgi:hypothetical protein
MKINRNNYEAFFIDYLEGNLDEKLVDDFIEFLQQNPDLKEELSLFEPVSVAQDEIIFNKKDLLFKEIYDAENEFDRAAIARIEGDISASENTDFENYLSSHPERQKEAELFEKTKLQPDVAVVFGKKNKLYRQSGERTVLLWTTRVAAVLIIAIAVYTFVDRTPKNIIPENQVAANKNEPEKKINSPEVKEAQAKKENVEEQKTIKKEAVKPAITKEQSKSNSSKSLHENSPDQPVNEELASIRITEEIPAELQSLSASIATTPEIGFVPINIKVPETIEANYEEKFLVDVVKEKTGIGKLTFNKITKAGLSLIANLSKEKFKYETNTEGKITELNYESRIFAFYIPTKNEEARK